MLYLLSNSGNCSSSPLAGAGSKTKLIFDTAATGALLVNKYSINHGGMASSRREASIPVLPTVPLYKSFQPEDASSVITVATLDNMGKGGASVDVGGLSCWIVNF